MAAEQKITCTNIWKLFGPDEKRIIKNLDKNLSIKEVQEKTGHVVAVKDVSFSIQKGETFVVMGLSGSGKSTLVRCISRLIEPTAGTVKMDDVEVTKMSANELLELVFEYILHNAFSFSNGAMCSHIRLHVTTWHYIFHFGSFICG